MTDTELRKTKKTSFYRMYLISHQAYLLIIGKLNVNVAPLPSLLFSAHILPPWASIILFDMNNPKPVPPAYDLVVNFVNTSTVITVDGVQLKPVWLQSSVLSVTLPENNALGLKPQTTPALSDGYWAFLKPLPPGDHTIHASGSLVDFTTTGTTNFASDVTYHITIKWKSLDCL